MMMIQTKTSGFENESEQIRNLSSFHAKESMDILSAHFDPLTIWGCGNFLLCNDWKGQYLQNSLKKTQKNPGISEETCLLSVP